MKRYMFAHYLPDEDLEQELITVTKSIEEEAMEEIFFETDIGDLIDVKKKGGVHGCRYGSNRFS